MTEVLNKLSEFIDVYRSVNFEKLKEKYGEPAVKLESSFQQLNVLIGIDVKQITSTEKQMSTIPIDDLKGLLVNIPELKDFLELMSKKYDLTYSCWLKTAQLLVSAVEFAKSACDKPDVKFEKEGVVDGRQTKEPDEKPVLGC
jgi:hypothetical protein